MGVPAGKVDAILARLGAKRRGIVSREELLAAGLSRRQIEARIASGSLVSLFPGVYAIGPLAALPPYALESAALVACRPRALLGGRTACGIWELPVEPPKEIDIVVVGRHRRSLEGVHVGSIDHLGPGELQWVFGLPVTSPSLTLLDVAADLGRDQLTAAVHEARAGKARLTDHQLRSTLRAHPNRRGACYLGAYLEAEGSAKVTRSEAERLALRLMRDLGLDPESDVKIGPYRVDFLFRAEKLIVEVDGYRFHGTPERFRGDRRRTAALMGMGYAVFPLTWWDLTESAADTVIRLLATLDERRP